MKIAKKVLALAIAVVMVASLSAMAFAAEEKITLTATEVEDNMFTLAIVVKDGDMQSVNWALKYDATAVKVIFDGEDPSIYFGGGVSKAVNKGKIMGSFNALTAGEVLLAIATTENLGKDVGSAFNAEEGVELLCIDFEVVNADAANVDVTLAYQDGGEVVTSLVLFEKEEETTAKKEEETTAKKEEETTAKKEEATTKAPVTPEEKTTAKGNTGANKPTGDTGLLAIAAGVVAVAGAAFVVTKKRK